MKIEADAMIQELYAQNFSLEEKEVKTKKPHYYQVIIRYYQYWHKALKENGINKKRIKERERFFLYWMMKKRFDKNPDKALRPKNIDAETKNKIIESYKTMKNLNRTIKIWDEDKIMYEIRAYFLTGYTMKKIQKEDSKLYAEILKQFDDIEAFQEEYYNRFGISLNEKINKKKRSMDNEFNTLKTMLIKTGELTEEQLTILLKAAKKTEEDVMVYLMEELLKVKKEKKTPTEKMIKENNLLMYYAMKACFGTLRQAMNEIKVEYKR